MTTDQIDALITRRNKLTNRRDGLTDSKRVKRIDAQLEQVPAGQDNRVDLLLCRSCAVLPERPTYGPQDAPDDYRIANRPGNPNWHGVKAWFDESALTVTQAEQYRLMSEEQPDGIVEQYSSSTEGHW